MIKQIAFLGTWNAVNEVTPISTNDIVGVWSIDHFELYYFAVGSTDLLPYSAKGDMGFPLENEWFNLTETKRFDGTNWINDSTGLHVKYEFSTLTDDSMSVYMTFHDPLDGEEYTWEFVKESDSVDPIY